MRGGHNAKPDGLKALQGTFRPDRAKATVALPALTKWPRAPGDFNEAEKNAWRQLGKALLPLGTVSEADLLLAATLARVMARVTQALADSQLKVTTLASLIRLQAELFKSFGLSPAARRGIEALPQPEEGADESDPLAVLE